MKICSLKSEEWNLFTDLIPPEKNTPSDSKIAYVALDENAEAAGILIVDFEFYIYQIDFLYVVPEKRHMGVATQLMDNFIGLVKNDPSGRDVVADIAYTDKSEGLLFFFRDREDFDLTASVSQYRAYAGDLHQYPTVKRLMSSCGSGHIVPLSECSDKKWNYYITELNHKGLTFAADLKKEDLDEKLTLFYIGDAGEPCAMIAFQKADGDVLKVLLLGSVSSEKIVLFKLLGNAFSTYRQNYDDKYFEFILTNPDMERVVNELFGDYACRIFNNRFIYNWN